jgi:hypothetical protein
MAKKKSTSKTMQVPKGWSITQSSNADERDFVGKPDAVGKALPYMKRKSMRAGVKAARAAAASAPRTEMLVQRKLIAKNADALGAVASKSGIFTSKGDFIGANG